MRLSPLSFSLALSLASAFPSTAAEQEWYLGAGAGWGNYTDLSDQEEDTEEGAAAISLFGGYQFDGHFGAELGYLYAGKATAANEDFVSQGATLSGTTRWPIGQRVSLFAEAGGYFFHAKGNDQSTNGIAPLVGAGLAINLSQHWDIQTRYRYLWDIGKAAKTFESDLGAVASLDLIYYPGRQSAPLPSPSTAPQIVAVSEPNPQTFTLNSDILFTFGEVSLSSQGRAALDDLVQHLTQTSVDSHSILVIGYADRLGTESFNLAVSEQRARHVADYLTQQGMITDIRVEGRGERDPVSGALCDDDLTQAQLISCLSPDRRVEIRITTTGHPSQP